MNAIDRDSCVLVLVDYQQRLLPTIAGGARVLQQALTLADIARSLGVPVIGTEQNPQGLGPNDAAIRAACVHTLAKRHFDACADGLLEALPELRPQPVRQVVVAGCEAHVCLMQTALGLRRAGLGTWVVAPACGSRRPEDHALAMQRLQGAGCSLASLEMVAFEWLRDCDHPQFRAVLAQLKALPV